MGASFRNVGEILELSGCDLLTISPNLLADLARRVFHEARDRKPAPRAQPRAIAKAWHWMRRNSDTFRTRCHGYRENC